MNSFVISVRGELTAEIDAALQRAGLVPAAPPHEVGTPPPTSGFGVWTEADDADTACAEVREALAQVGGLEIRETCAAYVG